jgi:hypothetical protein
MDETKRQEIVEALEVEMLKDLYKRIKDGTATAADRQLAWKVCTDNGILKNLKPGSGQSKDFLDSLPHFTDDGTGGVIGKVG